LISWLQDFGLVFDVAICVLLLTTIGYAMALNRKLTLLRGAKKDMEKLFAEFAAATGEAEGGLKALKDGSGIAAESLAKNVSDACRLADEMAFLVKKGHEIADRLEVAVAASRKAQQAAQPLTATSPKPAAPVPTVGSATDDGPLHDRSKAQSAKETAQDNARPAKTNAIAKLAKRKLSGADTELMRALQAIR
jgi:hypothetical protein